MKQPRNVRRLSMWKWVGAAFMIAAATGGALYVSMQPGSTAQAGAKAGAIPPGGSTYFIDPVTKESHATSPEEIQALLAAGGPATLSVAEPEPIVGVDGAPGLRLTDEQMTYTIATKSADGTVSVEHAAGKTEALEKVRAASVDGTKAGKER